MAVGNNFRQIFDQFDKLNTTIEGVMKCSVNVGEDMQEESEKYGDHVDKIEQYLLEFAKLSEDVTLRKAALHKVEQSSIQVQEHEEPLDLSEVFLSCLEELKASRKASYDPRAHPLVQEFTERVRNPEESDPEEETTQDEEESELVVGQVDKSLKCPITKTFFEDPVMSQVCKHSYSSAAILAHIRSRKHTAKCPVCAKPIKESDLVKDKKLVKLVRKAQKGRKKSTAHASIIKL